MDGHGNQQLLRSPCPKIKGSDGFTPHRAGTNLSRFGEAWSINLGTLTSLWRLCDLGGWLSICRVHSTGQVSKQQDGHPRISLHGLWGADWLPTYLQPIMTQQLHQTVPLISRLKCQALLIDCPSSGQGHQYIPLSGWSHPPSNMSSDCYTVHSVRSVISFCHRTVLLVKLRLLGPVLCYAGQSFLIKSCTKCG